MPSSFALIKIAAAYSNAVFAAVLPSVGEFGLKVEAPISYPLRPADVKEFVPSDVPGEIGGNLLLKNGTSFWFSHGQVLSYRTSASLQEMAELKSLARYFGPIKLTEAEATKFARDVIRRLGYSEESLYADLEPVVEAPPRFGTNTVPRFVISWQAPNRASESVRIEVAADVPRVESLFFNNKNTWRELPPFPEAAEIAAKEGIQRTHEEVRGAFLSNALSQIEAFSSRLELPATLGVGTEEISDYTLPESGKITGGRVQLKNGYKFFVTRSGIQGFWAPDAFFDQDREVVVKQFVGPWRMTEKEAVQLATWGISRLGYKPHEMSLPSEPEVVKPSACVHNRVPRYLLRWSNFAKQTFIDVEIDAEGKKIKGLFVHRP